MLEIKNSDWELRDYEEELFFRELEPFIPDKIFDAHAHIYNKSQFLGSYPEIIAKGPVDIMTIAKYREYIRKIIHRREIFGFFLGWPKSDENFDVDENIVNRFLSKEVRNNPNCRGSMIINPDMNPEFIRQEVRKLKLSGLKCYHAYSPKKPTYSADISSYLPESHVRVAHEEGLFITLHLVKERALADKKNQEIIIRYCKRYPDMKMILAHGGRGFNPYHVLEGISSIRELDNVWFDSSAVTEAGTFEIIIRSFGHKHLLYGSDFPVSHERGRCIAIGDGMFWLNEKNIKKYLKTVSYSTPRLVMMGLENLRCLKLAIFNLKLSDNQIEDIFYNNARQLFGLKT